MSKRVSEIVWEHFLHWTLSLRSAFGGTISFVHERNTLSDLFTRLAQYAAAYLDGFRADSRLNFNLLRTEQRLALCRLAALATSFEAFCVFDGKLSLPAMKDKSEHRLLASGVLAQQMKRPCNSSKMQLRICEEEIDEALIACWFQSGIQFSDIDILSSNGLTCKFLGIILEQRALKSLSVFECALGDDSAQLLAQWISSEKGSVSLDCRENLFSRGGRRRLLRATKTRKEPTSLFF
jgi:hypothetical protein